MISPKHDLFARLATSAQRYKQEHPHTPVPVVKADPAVYKVESSRKGKTKTANKLDERITDIVSDPEIDALRRELEEAEELFHSLKKTEKNKELILRVENKILEMKRLLHKKSYV